MSAADFADGKPVGAPGYHEAEQFELPVIVEECERRLLEITAPSFSGKIIERDKQLVEAILSAFAGGISQRRIAQAFKVSRNTVAALVDRATAAGKIEPIKKRLSGKLGRAIEAGIEQWIDAVEEGSISPSQIPVAVGIFSDKKALLDGEATSRIERVEGPSMDSVMEKLQRAKVALAVPADVDPAGPGAAGDRPSTDNGADSQQKALSAGGWCGSGVDQGQQKGSEPAGGDDLEGVAAEGRGGGASIDDAPMDDGFGSD